MGFLEGASDRVVPRQRAQLAARIAFSPVVADQLIYRIAVNIEDKRAVVDRTTLADGELRFVPIDGGETIRPIGSLVDLRSDEFGGRLGREHTDAERREGLANHKVRGNGADDLFLH